MSFRAGAKSTGSKARRFQHNSIVELDRLADLQTEGDKYVFVEGLYSMRGDTADVEAIYKVTKKHRGILIVDDAHGTGTLGTSGRGIIENLHGASD
jgi:8-amino-7-oxononanoate synthase